MATFEELMAALRKADAAGDTEGAARIAQMASKIKGVPPVPQGAPAVPQDAPSPVLPQDPVTPGGFDQQIIGLMQPEGRSQVSAVSAPAPAPRVAPIMAGPIKTNMTPRVAMPVEDPLLAALRGEDVQANGAPMTYGASRDANDQRPPSDPFEGEGFKPLAKRRGQQFARGAAEVVASVPESVAITGEMADRSRAAGAVQGADFRAQLIADIDARLADPATPANERAILERNKADMMQGIDTLRADATQPIIPAQKRPIFASGDQIRGAVADVVGLPDPRDVGFWSQAAEGSGNMAGMIAASAAGGLVGGPAGSLAVGGMTGSTMNQSQVFKEALDAGADQETALQASKWAAVIGAGEIIPINRALKILPPRLRGELATGFMRKFVDLAQASGEEAAQEYLSQVANNIAAQKLYDPERGWTEGATDAALVGAVLGAGVGGIGLALEGKPAAQDVTAPPRREEPRADPLSQITAAMQPPAPDQAPKTPAPEQPAPQAATNQIQPQPSQGDAGRYEILDEIENGPDGQRVPTGRKVRYDRQTGTVEPISPDQPDAATAPEATAPAEMRKPADAEPAPEVEAAPKARPAPPVPAAGPAPQADVVQAAGGTVPPAPIPNQPRNFEFIDAAGVAKIGTEPGVMQYKAGGDAEGVTDRLKGVTEWRPERAGMSIIYEYADGRRVIADGHQRLGLAKRLAGEGKAIQMPAMILRQVDGVTPEDARVTAALKNIAEGSGTALDAAKVLRGTDKTPDQLGLPPASAIVRDAMGMRNLSDQAFGMVVNGVSSERDGGIVGRAVTDKAAQANILALLARMQKDRPITAFQAESVARQAAADTVVETQDSLFGPEDDTRNLYLERAKILEAASKMKREEQSAFRNVIANADRLAAAGNQLDADGNQTRLDSAAAMRDYLGREANTKGAISEALTAAARALNGGATVAAATRQFLDAVERELGARGSERQGGDQRGQAAGSNRPQESGDQGLASAGQDEAATDGDLFAPAQTGKTPDQVRAEAEAAVRAQQSKLRKPDGNSGDAGPLFNPDQDLFDPPKAKQSDGNSGASFLATGAALRAELKAAVTEEAPLRKSTDLTEKGPGVDLERRLAAATSSEERQKVAADFTLERGRQTGNEHLVFLGPDGALISLTEGDPKGVEFPDAAHQAVVTGKASFSVHNHPGNRGPSSADIGNLFGGVDPMVIVGHDGARHEMRRSEAAMILKPADAIRAYKVMEARLVQLWRRDQGGASPDALNQQFHNVIVVTMERLGLIEYDGTAATDIKANGIETDDLLPSLFSAVASGLRRSGYSIPEIGDRGGNSRAGADAAQPGTESAPRNPSGLPEGGDRRGRVPDRGLKPAPKADKPSSGNTDIDSAPDDTTKPTSGLAEDEIAFEQGDDAAFAAQIMQELAQVDDLFQNPRSSGTTLKAVFADIDPSIAMGGRLAKDDPRAEDKDADEVFFGQTAKGKPFYVMQTGKEVWIDVSDLSQGDGGNAIYSAISDYALNTGKVFVGDPAGLSFKALRRRTDNMLSTALKHGTTRHIEPHPDQVSGHPDHGIPGLRWTDGDDAGNLSSLIEVSIANLTSLVPEVADARYDFQTGTFRTGEGQPLSDVALDGWVSAAGRSGAARIGRATLKRGILLNTLAQSESGERPGILARSLRQSRQLVTRGGLRRTFYQASHPIVKDADAATDRIAAMMPKLRAELDRLDLKRVKLAMDSGSDWQGMFQVTGDGAMEITIAASLDPMKTLHHEVIHALRSLDLFTPSEWRALELAAERGWIEKHDIAARYPDLLPHEQIEEAIAEEFSEALAAMKSPKGSALVTAFNKIARLFRALRNVLNGAGYQTAEDIFGRILAGEISKRQAGSHKGRVVAGQRKQRKREASFSPTALDRIRNANAAYGAPQGPLELPVPDGYDLPKRRHLFGIQQLGSISEEFQDRFIQLEAINRAIEKRTGEQIPDTHNARLRQTVFDGRTASRLEKLISEEVDPLTAEMKRLGISVDDLGTYLLAKHAPERNAVMKTRDPERFSDGNGSGLYDEAAADLLREFDEKGQTAKLERLAKMVKVMLDKDLALRRYAGLIGEGEFQSFKAMYKNYSPLRGFAERDDGEQIGRIGRGFDLRGREVRNALGRMTISENPLVQAIAMRQEGIVRAEKARVARALYQQVQRYPDPGIWEIIGKLPKRKVLDADTGMARDIVDFGALREAEVIGVKIGGEVQYIRIKDPLLAESLKNMSNQSPALVAQLLSGIRRVTRAWGALQTGANPNFVFPNSQSDFLEGVWTAFNVDGASKVKMVASYAKSYPLALAAAIQSEIGNSALGRGLSKIPVPALKRIFGRDVDPEDMARLERFVREWEASGGKIAFQGFRDLDEITRDINAAMAKDGWRRWATKPWTAVGDVVALVEKVNQPIESAGRLAMYIAARENGFSKDKAAAMSLDSSGNFYRRGRATPSFNALYAFFNASIQGFEKLVRFSKRPRNWAIFGGLAASGLALTAMNILAWDDDDDPEGRSLFMDIPQFERDRSIIIPYGVEEDAPVVGADGKTRRAKRLKYASFRLPHNLRPFWVMGTALAETFLKQTDPDEAALNISRSFLAGSNPFGSENLWNAAAPTILDPAVDLSFNRDWTGKPVHPEEAPWNDGVPRSSQYHPRSTSPAAIWLAQTMNDVTGGDGFESGAIDVYPNDLQHVFDYATGGLGRFFRMSGEAVADRAAGIETDPGRVPVLRSLLGRTNARATQDRYYLYRNRASEDKNRVRALYKSLQKDPDNPDLVAKWKRISAQFNVEIGYGGDLDWTASTLKIFDATDDRLKELRGQLTDVQADDSLSRADRVAKEREITLQIEDVQRAAIKTHLDMAAIAASKSGPVDEVVGAR